MHAGPVGTWSVGTGPRRPRGIEEARRRQPAESGAMHRRRLRLHAATFALGVAAGAAAADDAAVLRPCRVGGLPHEVRCGAVSRPLDPSRPEGRRIDVHFLVVPSTAPHKREDPVFFFAGGPGQSAIALAPRVMPWFARLNRRRDIVFIDQRGTGRSAPLECAPDDALPLAERLDVDRGIERLRACRRHLETLPHGVVVPAQARKRGFVEGGLVVAHEHPGTHVRPCHAGQARSPGTSTHSSPD